jgi:hypothetical protein
MQAVLFIVFIKTKSAQILQSKFPNYSDWYYRQRNRYQLFLFSRSQYNIANAMYKSYSAP